MPRCGEACLGVKKTHGDLVFTGGVVDREPQIVREAILDSASEGLHRLRLATKRHIHWLSGY